MFNAALTETAPFHFAESNLALEQRVEARTAELTHALAIVEAQKHALEAALRMRDETQHQLEVELEDAQLLHGISAMLIDEDATDDLYQKLVDAATLIMHSDFGSMQRYDHDRGELQLIANRGLNDEAVAYWQWVYPERATTCGKALQMGKRVIVPDFERCEFIANSEDLLAFRKAGVRSAQSTPLLTRNGRLVGMITTHWIRCHEPQERELRLLDIVARQAADLIERNTSATALRQQASQLIEADRYKNEFLATLAHELRNPLAPIQTGLTLLKIGAPEQAPRVFSMMERQLGHMVRLIDDLLDVSRISHGKVILKRTRVELAAIIESAVETSRPLINAGRHRLTVTIPGNTICLHADATRVAQVVSNLLNNAAKYTPQGGDIELVAEVIGSEVMIRIADTGIGIPSTMISKIFELFTQVDGAERSQGGLGVGLALAKQLAELHEGRIEVQSPWKERGSAFTLHLPVIEATTDRTIVSDQYSPSLDGASARILIVDDNEDAAVSLGILLTELGCTTRVVLKPTEAVATALEFSPDVVFLDLGMPELDGFELARRLRGQGALKNVNLTALSGWGTDEDRERTRHAGFDHHLTKPAVIKDVAAIISNHGRRP